MVLLLGATGYIGQAFARALRRRKDAFIPLSLGAFDYTRFDDLFDYVRKVQPELLINAEERGGLECWNDGLLVGAGGNAATEGWSDGVMKAASADSNHLSNAPAFQHSRTPAESERMEILQANTVLPQTIAHVCDLTRTPWGHVSSGSIYFGAKTLENGNIWSLKDLGLASIRRGFLLLIRKGSGVSRNTGRTQFFVQSRSMHLFQRLQSPRRRSAPWRPKLYLAVATSL